MALWGQSAWVGVTAGLSAEPGTELCCEKPPSVTAESSQPLRAPLKPGGSRISKKCVEMWNAKSSWDTRLLFDLMWNNAHTHQVYPRKIKCWKTLRRDLFDGEMVLLVWRRRTRGGGSGDSGSSEGTLSHCTHQQTLQQGLCLSFLCALRVPQLLC